MTPSQPTPRARAPRRALRLTPSFWEWTLGLALAVGLVAYWINSSSRTGALLMVEDHMVAAVVGAFDGEVVIDDTPGYRIVRPFLEDSYSVVKSPVEYRMTGNEWANDNLVPRLAVRAADGSNVWFEDVRIQYGVQPMRVWDVMKSAGGDYAWRHGIMDSYARSCLRDALGVYSAEEIVQQDNLRAARIDAKDRLNAALDAHGLVVLELSTSKPAFPKAYESVVQRRQIAEQETLKIAQELEQLRASRDDRVAKLERDKTLELARMRSKVARDLASARKDAFVSRRAADGHFKTRIAAGARERAEMASRADALTLKYTAEAEGIVARADALAAKGRMAVRQALVESLKKVTFEIAPFDLPEGDRARRASRNL